MGQEGLWCDVQQGQEICLFSKVSITVLGLTQSYSPQVKLTTHLDLVSRLGIVGAVLHCPMSHNMHGDNFASTVPLSHYVPKVTGHD